MDLGGEGQLGGKEANQLAASAILAGSVGLNTYQGWTDRMLQQWRLEGGTDYGVRDDADPARHHFGNHDHLVSLLGPGPYDIKWAGVADGFRVPKPGAAIYQSQGDPAVHPVIIPVFFWEASGAVPAPSPTAMIASKGAPTAATTP